MQGVDRFRVNKSDAISRVWICSACQSIKNQFSTFGRFRRLFIFTSFQITRVRSRRCVYSITRDCMYFIFQTTVPPPTLGSRCIPGVLVVELNYEYWNRRDIRSRVSVVAGDGRAAREPTIVWNDTIWHRFVRPSAVVARVIQFTRPAW